MFKMSRKKRENKGEKIAPKTPFFGLQPLKFSPRLCSLGEKIMNLEGFEGGGMIEIRKENRENFIKKV